MYKDKDKVALNQEDYRELSRLKKAEENREIKKAGFPLKLIAIVTAILGLIPFLPGKSLILIIGAILGAGYYSVYEGNPAYMIANLVLLAVRLVLLFIVIFFPMFFWIPIIF